MPDAPILRNEPNASLSARRGIAEHRSPTRSTRRILSSITQAICEYRAQNGITGPLFLAKDTHALSEPAFVSALEVLAANDVDVMIDAGSGIHAHTGAYRMPCLRTTGSARTDWRMAS